MTRLREEDISSVTQKLKEYDEQLFYKTGTTLAGIAAYALDKKQEDFHSSRNAVTIAVVPISCDQGIIHGFSQTVQQIIEFMGFTAFVTASKDVGGIAEAVQRGAKVVFLADDDHFVAIHLSTGKVVDNGEATGKGYAAALALMAGGLMGKEVLLMGAGPVGIGAASFMTTHGAQVLVYDLNKESAENLRKIVPDTHAVQNLENALCQYRLLFEATPAADSIGTQYIADDTMISAPGIPLGVNKESLSLVSNRLIHDVLEIGVATMLFSVLAD